MGKSKVILVRSLVHWGYGHSLKHEAASHFCFLDQQEHVAFLPQVEPGMTERSNAMRSIGLGLGYLSPLGWPVERIPKSFPWKLGSELDFFFFKSVVGKVGVVISECSLELLGGTSRCF